MKQEQSYRFVNARLITPDGPRQATVCVRGGKVDAIDGPASASALDVDLGGVWLLPGAIDAHVHFDEPGFTHREDFASGTRAAAAGGVTTIVDMPCTSLPPVTDGASFDHKMRQIQGKGYVDYRFWGGVRGNDFEGDAQGLGERLDEMRHRGVRAIKTYLISGMDTFRDVTAGELRAVLDACKARDLVVGVHAEDRAMVLAATEREKARADATALAYARGRDANAEAAGIKTCIELAAETGARLHVVHVASGKAVALVRDAKARGVNVTIETCPHYLAFTDSDLERLGGLLKTAPVVKSAADREQLWTGLQDGTIDMLATDHAPGKYPEEKTTGSIWTDYGGVPGVELMLSYLMSEGVAKGRLTPWRAIELLCEGPARIHRLTGKGKLEVGADADLVVFDPNEPWLVDPKRLLTRQKYTPMAGMQLTGKVKRTYLRGRLVYDDEHGVTASATGRFVNP